MTSITGAILVGAEERTTAATFDAIDPSTGHAIGPKFHEAAEAEVADACALAAAAAPAFGALAPDDRATFLETIADRIVAIGDELIVRAIAESGLPRARLEGERGRTVGQLRLFAAVLREGSWMDLTVDAALPDRAPLPRPDLRRMNLPVGPVAVFGASNFPLAFSVAGGDTASALAAGCPVLVKGHPAHPGTGELVARAIRAGGGRLRAAGGRLLLPARHHQRAGRRAGRRSADQGGRLHRLARRRAGAGPHRASATRADPGLCRDVEHQPGHPLPRRRQDARRRAGRGLSSPR